MNKDMINRFFLSHKESTCSLKLCFYAETDPRLNSTQRCFPSKKAKLGRDTRIPKKAEKEGNCTGLVQNLVNFFDRRIPLDSFDTRPSTSLEVCSYLENLQ